jgi:hypothetical protein
MIIRVPGVGIVRTVTRGISTRVTLTPDQLPGAAYVVDTQQTMYDTVSAAIDNYLEDGRQELWSLTRVPYGRIRVTRTSFLVEGDGVTSWETDEILASETVKLYREYGEPVSDCFMNAIADTDPGEDIGAFDCVSPHDMPWRTVPYEALTPRRPGGKKKELRWIRHWVALEGDVTVHAPLLAWELTERGCAWR